MRSAKKNRPWDDSDLKNREAATPRRAESADVDQEIAATRQAKRSVAGPRFLARKDWLVAGALVVAVFLVYIPCWHGTFLFDDDVHLLHNPVIHPGGLAKVWVLGGYNNYWPITYTAYWLQFQLWRLEPFGYHLVNLALHAACALLVWRVLLRLQVPGAIFAAALFALHPVNVESVAWISQLKGLLSLMLALVSVLFFLAFERRSKRWLYGLAIATFLFSALAKGSAITFPVVLLACAWWQRGRIQRRDIVRVLPYLLIGAVMAGIEVWSQHHLAQSEFVRTDGFLSRLAVAGCAFWFYFWKLIWPLKLSPIYPMWKIDPRSILSYLPGALVLILLALAWWRRGTWGRTVMMLIVCYAALLLPVLGFVNITFMSYSLVADHWQYTATIVVCAAFAGMSTILARRLLPRAVAISAGLSLLAVLAVLSGRQSGVYRNAETFYETAIARNPDCWVAENNLGTLLLDRGEVGPAMARYEKAIEIHPKYASAHFNLAGALASRGEIDAAIGHYLRALQLEPGFADAHNNFANVLLRRGQIDAAISHYKRAIEIDPGHATARDNLGVVLADLGQADAAVSVYQSELEINPDDARANYSLGNLLADRGEIGSAIAHYRRAIEIEPRNAEAENNLGNALLRGGQMSQALVHFRSALEIKPDYPEAHYNLAAALAVSGQIDSAILQYEKVLEIEPDYAMAHNNLALILGGRGEIDLAIGHYQKALKIEPQLAEAENNLANALASRGQVDSAVAHYRRALKIKPNYAEAHYNLAMLLAVHGQTDSAISHYEKAVEIKPDYAVAHCNLGVAYGGQGDFDSAVAHFQRALEIRPDYAVARNNLAVVRSELEKLSTTLSQSRQTIRFHPNDAPILIDTAWMLATNPNASIRDGAESVKLAERAMKLPGGDNAATLGCLAAAYAEAGRFPEAVRVGQQAVQAAEASGEIAAAERCRSELELFKNRKPYRQPASTGKNE